MRNKMMEGDHLEVSFLKLLEVISISRAPVPGVSGHSVFTSGCFRVQELRVALPFLLHFLLCDIWGRG